MKEERAIYLTGDTDFPGKEEFLKRLKKMGFKIIESEVE